MKHALTCAAAFLAIIGAIGTLVAQESPQSVDAQSEQTKARVFSTTDLDSPHARFTVSVSPASSAETVKVEIEATISKGWHICPIDMGDSDFGLPTTIELKSKDLKAIEKGFTPSVAPTTEKVGEEKQEIHTGAFKWTRNYKSTKAIDEIAVEASIQFQVCDNDQCLPPKTIRYSLEPAVNSSESKKKPETVKLNYAKIGQPIEVALKDCDLKRRKVKMGDVSVLSMMLSGGLGDDSLDLTGEVTIGSESFNVYLPNEDEYVLKNTGTGKTRFENTATYMSIDHNGDGKLADSEAIAIDSPIRFADSMFRVTSVDRKSKKMTFQQVDAPIVGAIVGRSCPPFSYTTTNGETITDKSILGKVTILDIWAVT